MSEPDRSIRVLIADDHPVVRQGLRMLLEMASGVELVGEATDGGMAVRLTAEEQPDVVLMDLRMPGMDGLEAIVRIRSQWPQVAVLILTTYNEDDLMIRGLRAGACGYLLKDTDLDLVLQAIHVAARGEMLAQPEILHRLLSHAARAIASAPLPDSTRRGLALTEREREILAGVARGERSKEIAARLVLSERTVESYLSTIYAKLGVDSRAAAVAAALERGLLPRS
jgi:NarL family two-component system response regulator YdfI